MGHKVLGVNQILAKRYKVLDIPSVWVDSLGQLPRPFTMLITGQPKNGKTNFLMQVCKMLCQAGQSVLYNSCEEGDSKTMQDAFIRQGMADVAGKFRLGDALPFSVMCNVLDKPRSAQVVVIDSLDYMHLTHQQYKDLVDKYGKTKSFIIVCWGDNSASDFAKPDNYHAARIKYMVGSVILVKNFVATSRGRYGSTTPYVIWEEGAKRHLNSHAKKQLKLF